MNKKFLSVMLLATFFLGSASLFTACSDDDTVYDDSSVTSQISSLTSQLATLQSALSEAQSTAESATSAAASASTAASQASSLAESAAATAKAEAIEEAIEQTKTLIAASQSATDEEITALSLLIEGIDSDLNELSSSLSSVSADVKANTTAVAALTVQMDAVEKYMETSTASKDSLAEVTANIEADLAALTTVVDGKCTMDEVESYIAQVLSGDTQVVYTKDEVDALLEKITSDILDIQSELLTLKTDKLTSLVFIPELYVNGIEATRYVYAADYGFMAVYGEASDYTDDGQSFVFGTSAIDEFASARSAAYYYRLTPSAKMSYHYNPSSAVLEGVTFGFDMLNVETITRSTPEWSASCDSTTYKNGTLDVYYKIDDPTALVDPKVGEDEEVPVMSLKATLANDTTVNSDYAAIVPSVRSLNYIAFTETSGYEAPNNNQGSGDNLDLYLSGSDAAKEEASITWAYNGGTLDLASKLCIHYAQADYGDYTYKYGCDGIMTVDELEAWGLSLKFTALEFLVGSNKTDQSAYCEVTEDGKFTPCYVDENGVSQLIIDTAHGKSSIGRTPVVLVTLVNADDVVITYGYIKIEIAPVTVDPTPSDKPIEAKSKTFAFDCNTESVSISWSDVSGKLYEAVSMSAEDFRKYYTTDGNTYILNASGEYVINTDYGSVKESGDPSGSATTTVLTATVTEDQKYNIYNDFSNHTQTIYLKYSYGSSNVYVGFTITVADLPSVTLGERIASQWTDNEDGNLNDGDETKWNVPSPVTGGDVTQYEKTLDDLFYTQKIVATLGGDNASLYDANEVNYTYSFASTQDKIGSYTLYVSPDSLRLYANSSMTSQYLVAEITDETTGAIEYAHTDVAKEILNLYSHSGPTFAYAKILVTATYGTCKLPLETRYFYLDFIRPIDIVAGADTTFVDATANGSAVSMASLISITDWRNVPVYSESYSGGYVDNKVNLYEYYQFQNITIDLANAMYSTTGEDGSYKYKASEASIVLSLEDESGTPLANNTVSITSASKLSNIYIRQYNNSTVANQYYLSIPVEVTYSWGTISYDVIATVKKTKGTSKAN